MDSDSDFGFGGSDDEDASFTQTHEEEQQQQDENIARVGHPCKIVSNRTMHRKCMEAWRLQLVSRSEQHQCMNTLYFSAYVIFILHFGCSPLLILFRRCFVCFMFFAFFRGR